MHCKSSIGAWIFQTDKGQWTAFLRAMVSPKHILRNQLYRDTSTGRNNTAWMFACETFTAGLQTDIESQIRNAIAMLERPVLETKGARQSAEMGPNAK